jgi:hypothetical protein
MRRYVVDYTNGHDLSVCDEIMGPGYRITIGGETLEFDAYKAMVGWAYERFPDLRLVVHEFVTNGERLAMRFSETATSPAHEDRRGVWEGIGLYSRAADGKLARCRVEQDFYGRRRQLAGEAESIVPVEEPAVWSATAMPASPEAELAVRDWLAAHDSGAAVAGAVVEDGGAPKRLLSERTTEIDDIFSAGSRVAFSATMRGRYAGGLHGTEGAVGSLQHLGVIGLASAEEGRVTGARLVTDRFGLRRRLRDG